MFLVMLMLLSFSVNAIAAESEIAREILSEIKNFQFTGQVDTNYTEVLIQGTSKPTSYWNLVNDYNGEADWSSSIYTNYYFSPNEDGEIYVNFSLDYGFAPNPDRGFYIVLYKITSSSALTTYERIVDEQYESGAVKFYNLDPNTFYYFKFVKTNDGDTAHLDFTVYR